MPAYHPRIIDSLLTELTDGLPAVAIEGAKGVGKTASAQRLAKSIVSLDEEPFRANVAAAPQSIVNWEPPILIDEWQMVPPIWDTVRREVDKDRTPGRFILTGSSTPAKGTRIHSGAGRIVRVTMRPMSLPERGVTQPTVSFSQLLAGTKPQLGGVSTFGLTQYVHEILASGFPGIRQDPEKLRKRQLDSYMDNALEHDVTALGVGIRRPIALHAWLSAYAAATAQTTSYSTLLDAATPGDGDKISRASADIYRELLQQIRLLEPLPAWIPVFNPLKRLTQAPKHHLVDPALAAAILNATEASLISGRMDDPRIRREESLLSGLFESLAVLSLRVFAEPENASVSHMRLQKGEHEIDAIVERGDHKVLAIEVKLAGAPTADDVKHLNWLETQIGDALIDKILINTGPTAYRRPDGVAVIPLALLGA